jgi:hypothetical protein
MRKLKIEFDLTADAWHGCPCEVIWAEEMQTPSKTKLARLLNSPFFATGVSLNDVVAIAPASGASAYKFTEVFEHSGHSTFGILSDASEATWGKYWGTLEALGCSYESAVFGKRTLYSVDVSRECNIYEVYGLLKKGEDDEIWTFQENHVGHTQISND